jgi:hypothetical protein
MKNQEKVFENNKDLIVAFHIGRGGRFYNSGHLSYIGEYDIDAFTEKLFMNEDETMYTDGDGNELLEVENGGIGRIDIDGAYDTTYTCKVSDLDEKEIDVILATESQRGFNGRFAQELIAAAKLDKNEDNY